MDHELIRCAECGAVQACGPVAQCAECGSRQMRSYHPIPQIRIRATAGDLVSIEATDFLSARRYGTRTVVELLSGSDVETFEPVALIEAKLWRALMGGGR